MQHSKNKIVFGSVVAIVILFIISYSMMVFDDNSSDTEQLQQTLLPELNEPQENYKSKLKAIEALKAKKELNGVVNLFLCSSFNLVFNPVLTLGD